MLQEDCKSAGIQTLHLVFAMDGMVQSSCSEQFVWLIQSSFPGWEYRDEQCDIIQLILSCVIAAMFLKSESTRSHCWNNTQTVALNQ